MFSYLARRQIEALREEHNKSLGVVTYDGRSGHIDGPMGREHSQHDRIARANCGGFQFGVRRLLGRLGCPLCAAADSNAVRSPPDLHDRIDAGRSLLQQIPVTTPRRASTALRRVARHLPEDDETYERDYCGHRIPDEKILPAKRHR